MVTPTDEFNISTKLRKKAEAQLQSGTAPTRTDWSLGVDALRLLHRLSSDPDNAHDALKLLHELQVHQVELDVQSEEIAANERVLIEDLSLYQTLFDYAPMGYFLLNLDGEVIQANIAGAELLGMDRETIEGQPLEAFLLAQSRPHLAELLQQVLQSGARDSCVAETDGRARESRQLRFIATLSPDRTQFFLACPELANAG